MSINHPHTLYIQFYEFLYNYKKDHSSWLSTYTFPQSIGTLEPSISDKPKTNSSFFVKNKGYGALPQGKENNLLSELEDLLNEFESKKKEKFVTLEEMFLKIYKVFKEEYYFGDENLGTAIYNFIIEKCGIKKEEITQPSKEKKVGNGNKADLTHLIKETIRKMASAEVHANTNNNNNNDTPQPQSFGSSNSNG